MNLKLKPIVVFLLSIAVVSMPVKTMAKDDEATITLAYGLETYTFSSILSRFTAETGINVTIKAFKNNELKSELIQRSNIKELPDAIIVPADFLGLKQIAPSVIPTDLVSPDIYENALNTGKVGNVLKGIPIIFGNHLVLFYNKNMINSPPISWEALLTNREEFERPLDFIGWSYYEMYWFIPFLGAFNSQPFVNSEPRLNSEEMVEALIWYRTFLDDRTIDVNCEYSCVNHRFKGQSLAMTINGVWEYQAYRQALGDNLGVAPLPTFQNNQMKSYFSSHVLAFPNNGLSKKKSASLKKLALFFQREDIQKQIWVELKSIPTNIKTFEQIKAEASDDFKLILEQLNHSTSMPNDHEMAIVWEALLKGLNRYLADVFDAKTTAEYMQVITQKSIENNNDE